MPDKSAFEKYKGRGTKYKLKVPRASGSPEYAEAEPKGNFQLYIVICPLYIPTNADFFTLLLNYVNGRKKACGAGEGCASVGADDTPGNQQRHDA